MASFPFPHHPSCRSIDPLSICEDAVDGSDGTVPHAHLINATVKKADGQLRSVEEAPPLSRTTWVTIFSGLVEDIAYSLHLDSSLRTEGLKELLSSRLFSDEELSRFRTCLIGSALSLEELFATQTLEQLTTKNQSLVLQTDQVDCLIAHLLLITLQIPTGNTWGRPGFTQIFGQNEATKNTSHAYLQTVIKHFASGGYAKTLSSDSRILFELSSGIQMPRLSTSDLPVTSIPVTIVDKPSEPSTRDNCFVLVAAHSQPGPGPGGTQEERLVGQSPALAIASLLVPLLPSDAAVITSPLPVHSRWSGHGREASMLEPYPATSRPYRRYIIADALELDNDSVEHETSPTCIEREVRKLYAAFSGAKQSWLNEGRELEDLRIEMPPWGCGAFGGTLSVKAQCMMMAAGLAGLESRNLELFVPRDRGGELNHLPQGGITVHELFSTLTGNAS